MTAFLHKVRNGGITIAALLAAVCTAPLTQAAEPVLWQSGAAQMSLAPSAAEMEASLNRLAARTDAAHIVIQFERPLSSVQRDKLAAAGIALQSYINNNAYFATLGTQVNASAALSGAPLAGVSEVLLPWKLHPSLLGDSTFDYAIVDDTVPGNPMIGSYIVFHKDVPLADGVALVEDIYQGVVRDTLPAINAAVIELPRLNVAPLAGEDSVQWIEPPLPRFSETNAENRAITQANTAQAAPYNLDGTGVTALIYDGGLARATHVDFGGRLTTIDSSGVSNHPTHVAGTVGGNGAASSGSERGMAPNVTLISAGFEYDGSGIFLYSNPGDIQSDYLNAINNYGADISNNSIGTNTATNGFPCDITGDYGVTAALIDAIVRGDVSGSPFRVIWANGNERQTSRCGEFYWTTAPPATNKNAICVGALNANDDSMTSFSSWGPTDDGRIKPDISAPGCQSNGDGGVTSCGSASDTAYSTLCGTSMASPTVCGLSCLLLQDYRAQFPGQPDPRNSTLKALYAQTAADVNFFGPDHQTGYGSIRIVNAIDFMRSGQFEENEVSGSGDIVEYRITVPPGTPEIKLTLAWDDAPGTPNSAKALVNDLDLLVFDPQGARRRPWYILPGSPANPPQQTQEDHISNIEQVYVANPSAGEWVIQVSGFNVPEGPQPYSLTSSLPYTELANLAIQLPAGTPNQLSPGVAESFDVEVDPGIESLVPGTAMLNVRYNGGAFIEIPLTLVSGNMYQATLPPAACGATPEYYLSAIGSDSGPVTRPATAPAELYSAVVGGEIVYLDDAVESSAGWVVGAPGDTATTGIWNLQDPEQTDAQPGDDHSPSGTQCWVTDGRAGTSVGTYDVDNGATTLTSPTYDLTTGDDPYISYWRWYSNVAGASPNADVFIVQISNNNGGSFVEVEQVGPSGPEAGGGWFQHRFRVADFVTPTAQIRLRFIAADDGDGSIVEAAIDDIRIDEFGCTASIDDCNMNGIADLDDIASGRSTDVNSDNIPDDCQNLVECPGDFDESGTIDLADLGLLLGCWNSPCGDIDGDNTTGLPDLGVLFANWGACQP